MNLKDDFVGAGQLKLIQNLQLKVLSMWGHAKSFTKIYKLCQKKGKDTFKQLVVDCKSDKVEADRYLWLQKRSDLFVPVTLYFPIII